MRYLLAILIPPLALLLCGKIFQALLCIFLSLTILGHLPAIAWALCTVANHKAEKRTQRIIQALRQPCY